MARHGEPQIRIWKPAAILLLLLLSGMKRDRYSSLDAPTWLPTNAISTPRFAPRLRYCRRYTRSWILFVEVWSWRIRELCGVVFSRVFRIWRNITFEKYRFPLYSRFSWDEKLYSFFLFFLFLFRRRTLPKLWTSREFLSIYIQFEIAEKSLRFTTTFVIIELGFVRSCYVVTSGTKRATSYSEIRNFLPAALIRWVLIRWKWLKLSRAHSRLWNGPVESNKFSRLVLSFGLSCLASRTGPPRSYHANFHQMEIVPRRASFRYAQRIYIYLRKIVNAE